ncbi:phospholipase D family protein [Pelagibius sp. 7325]|uniref:phospholipase D family protein n=1 Tax=Pelagibius sp. 7325 TaxID=3131994 RepID=UPI0030EBEE68
MPSNWSLDPEHRALYGASLQPPPGYTFDGAVATTYSLDLATALAVPVSLALYAAENREDILTHPLALLEGAERIAGRLLIFTDAGHIQADAGAHGRLCTLLEDVIVEVTAPGGGAFHPKMWALRYKPIRSEDPMRVRLLVLSRNLTRDRSWDISLILDGIVTKSRRAMNRPLVDFVSRLPELAVAGLPQESRTLAEGLAEDLRRADWTLPEPFESIAFAVNGLGGKLWRPEPCARLGVISPFCDDATLSMLSDLPAKEKAQLIGRADELAALHQDTLDRFDRVAVLDDVAATEDGEEADSTALQGLHAKAFIAENGWSTTLTIGSGNATRPALTSGHNVEIFASLTGKRSKLGGVEEIFGDEGFGRLTRPYIPGELAATDADRLAAEWRLEGTRRLLCGSGLKLRCERTDSQDVDGVLWRLWLVATESIALNDVAALWAWLITRGEGHRRDVLMALRSGQAVDLGTMPLADLTRFLAFQLVDGDSETELLFSTRLEIDGLPAERHAAILRRVIANKEQFFRYLRLLLSDLGDPFAAALAAQSGVGNGSWRRSVDDEPLLEEMVHAFCRGGDQLRAIERLITRLEAAEEQASDPVPPEFRALWESFRAALRAREHTHEG